MPINSTAVKVQKVIYDQNARSPRQPVSTRASQDDRRRSSVHFEVTRESVSDTPRSSRGITSIISVATAETFGGLSQAGISLQGFRGIGHERILQKFRQ